MDSEFECSEFEPRLYKFSPLRGSYTFQATQAKSKESEMNIYTTNHNQIFFFQFVLSQQRASIDHLDDVFNRSDIADVIACSNGALLLFKSGALWQYRKTGRDIVKTCLPVLHVAKIFCENDDLR